LLEVKISDDYEDDGLRYRVNEVQFQDPGWVICGVMIDDEMLA
jgi:hypothetical protein